MAEEPDRQGERPGTQGGTAGVSWRGERWDTAAQLLLLVFTVHPRPFLQSSRFGQCSHHTHIYMCVCVSRSVVSDSLLPHGL